MTKNDLKKLVAYLAVIGILWVAYYGNYLPLRKSQSFITMTRSAGSAQSWEDLKGIIRQSLDLPSPIGQEELVRNLSSMMLGVIRSNGQNAQLTASILDFVRGYFDPIIKRGKGMSFQQDLYIMGLEYQIAYVQTHTPAYLDQSEAYFKQSIQMAPKRPQAYYGLFDVYRLRGDKANADATARHILELWPTDTNLQDYLAGKSS